MSRKTTAWWIECYEKAIRFEWSVREEPTIRRILRSDIRQLRQMRAELAVAS